MKFRPGAWTILFQDASRPRRAYSSAAIIAGVRPRMPALDPNPLSSTLGQSYGVFRKDGITLIRDLEGRDMTARRSTSSPWYAAVQAGGGRYRVDVAF